MLIDKKCPVCDKLFQWGKNRKKQQITCSRNCSNTFFKRRTPEKPIKFNCAICDTESIRRYGKAKNKFCSHECFLKDLKENTLSRFNKGEVHQRPTLRKLISARNGYKCNCCGISKWNNIPITLQVNHIDGNCTNNLPKNLELICPNCHSQTPTFGGRNKGSGRKARGLPRHF